MPFGPASPSSQNILDSSCSIESINEMYEKYKNSKNPDNSFVREIKKNKDVDVEEYIKNSLNNPKEESKEGTPERVKSSPRRGRNARKAERNTISPTPDEGKLRAQYLDILKEIREEMKQAQEDINKAKEEVKADSDNFYERNFHPNFQKCSRSTI